MDLSYVLNKIRNTNFSKHPFRHLEINNLFEKEDLERIIKSPEISIKANNDKDLFKELFGKNYKIISFPGCTKDYREYMSWHKDKKTSKKSNTACEGYGVVVRLESPKTSPIKTLVQFINSKEFIGTIAEKFGVNLSDTTYDAGLQKYLDGYEISPHPDIRKKALTYMVNINPSPASFDIEHHTSYLRFKPKWRFVEEFWKGNAELDRCWVPWDWCEIQKQQRNNNSMVIFSPSHDTIHAVKADYDHLPNQRTQLYGNLWFNEHQNNETPNWEEFVITPTPNRGEKRLFSKFLPQRLKWFLEHRKNRGTHGQRNI